MKSWNDMPESLKNKEVLEYYNLLKCKKLSMFFKRLFDIIVSTIMITLMTPIFLLIAILIKNDSEGSVFFFQERVTRYGKIFKIIKFRTMVENADKIGFEVTVNNDIRITKIGKILRKYRLDEIPQLINILLGDMSFVGTRPEVEKYVENYTDKMKATLLMPAGVTSLASINFKDEEKLLSNASDVDKIYVEKILPEKMKYNLEYIEKFNFIYDIYLMLKTVLAVLK